MEYRPGYVVRFPGDEHFWSPGAGRHAGELAFVVEDVDAAREKLEAEGVGFLAGPADRPWGERTAYLLDPDGYLVEIAERI